MRPVPLSPAVRPYDHVLLDLDGCVWVGDEALPGAVDAVAALREAGKSILFLTNDVRHPPEGFVRKLWRLGFQASLRRGPQRRRRAAVRARRATAAAAPPSSSAPRRSSTTSPRPACAIVNDTQFATRADVVVVGGHDDFVFEELKVATQAVLRGAELIGATRDANFPMPDGPWPGTGAVLAAIETAAGRKAVAWSSASRSRAMYDAARDRLGAGPHPRRRRPARVDVAGARRAGLDSALVLTGATSRERGRRRRSPRPTFVADSLGALVLR